MFHLELCCPKCGETVYEQFAMTREEAERMAKQACTRLERLILQRGWDEWRDDIRVSVQKGQLT